MSKQVLGTVVGNYDFNFKLKTRVNGKGMDPRLEYQWENLLHCNKMFTSTVLTKKKKFKGTLKKKNVGFKKNALFYKTLKFKRK